MSKKVISLLLAVMLTASMIVVAAISVSADTDDEGSYVPSEGTETYHIYFCKPDDWENKYTSDAGVYWENGSDTPSAWPGYSARNADIKNVYCSDVPTDVDKVIWNNALNGTDDPTNPEYKLAYRTASATAAFATHHFHQFLNFFVSSRTAFNHFAFKDEIGACQRMVEVNDYYIRFDFYYAGIYALTVTGHQRYDITLFDMVAVELAVNLKDIFREINHVLLVILTVCLVCRPT